METKENIDFSKIASLEFIPLTFFKETLAKVFPFPYRSTFSFDPFIKKMEQNAGSGFTNKIKSLLPEMKAIEGFINQDQITEEHMDKLKDILNVLMPSLSLANEKVVISPPFIKSFLYETPAIQDLFAPNKWELKPFKNMAAHKNNENVRYAGSIILNTFYNQNFDLVPDQLITMREVASGLKKHLTMNFRLDFVEVKKLKPLKKLSSKDIINLLHNLDDKALWLSHFPPDNFEFTGFGIGNFVDVTKIEVLSILKDKLVTNATERPPEEFFNILKEQLQSFLNLPELKVGMIDLSFSESNPESSLSLTGISNVKSFDFSITGNPNAFQKAFQTKKPVVVGCINHQENISSADLSLLANGIESYILLPLMNKEGETGFILEIGSPQPMSFNSLSLHKLKDLFDLIIMGSDSYLQQIDSKIQLFIQQQFTSIHDSVEWKFKQAAHNYQMRSKRANFDGIIEPIVFQNIYPLYGQADIVSSSTIRNKAILEDLQTNLISAKALMKTWREHIHFHLLDSYTVKIDKILKRLKKEFFSSDESEVIDLLTKEIHPLLRDLLLHYPQLPKAIFEDYQQKLDPSLDIIYQNRKDYEVSVSRINQAIGNYIQEEDEKMQEILPHYFEKYKTDGVEYNLYIGQSLLEKGNFSSYFLKDFRIWQLENTCEITRLVNKLSPTLPVPLTTAQLIFVYNSPLSIRFRMDEKQFDVDGTYNVRYEILKKRIDKAVVKGTKERLTQAGKISIVFLQEKEKQEYLEYLDYLMEKGYIDPEIEDLTLEKLQGAEGLKALRIKVIG